MPHPYLLCRPNHYGVFYKINPWMDPERGADNARAMRQWEGLYTLLQELGANVSLIEQAQGQPDMVFTANAGLVRGGNFIPARFKFKERQGEEPAFLAWFEAAGFNILHLQRGSFEGEGDALFSSPEKLFVGYGFRTDRSAVDDVSTLLSVETIPCELVDSWFYHLDTCFCPLGESLAMFYPAAFTKETIRRFEKELELLAVPEADARRFACNAVVVGKEVVLPPGCTGTESLLTSRGYTPHGVELDEYLKAGGSAKCLSLKL